MSQVALRVFCSSVDSGASMEIRHIVHRYMDKGNNKNLMLAEPIHLTVRAASNTKGYESIR